MNTSKEQKNEAVAQSKQKLSPLETKVANELQIIRFLDNISEDSLLYLYDKAIPLFQQKMDNFIESSKPDLKEIWNETKKDLENIVKNSENIAKQNKISKSFQRDSLIWSIPVFLIIIGIYFALYYFLPTGIPDYLIFIPFILLCITNSLVSRLLLNKRIKFRLEKTPILKEQVKDSLIGVRNFNQIIINDIKNTIKENKFEPSKFKTYLYNKEYQNIKVLATQQQQKVPIHLIGIDLGD